MVCCTFLLVSICLAHRSCCCCMKECDVDSSLILCWDCIAHMISLSYFCLVHTLLLSCTLSKLFVSLRVYAHNTSPHTTSLSLILLRQSGSRNFPAAHERNDASTRANASVTNVSPRLSVLCDVRCLSISAKDAKGESTNSGCVRVYVAMQLCLLHRSQPTPNNSSTNTSHALPSTERDTSGLRVAGGSRVDCAVSFGALRSLLRALPRYDLFPLPPVAVPHALSATEHTVEQA